MTLKHISAAVLAVALVPQVAAAATVEACTDQTNYVTGSLTQDDGDAPTCAYVDGISNDSASAFNGLSLFGFNDWMRLGRDNGATFGDHDEDPGEVLDISGTGQGGSWDITNGAFSDYIIMLKPGNDVFAYLVTDLSGGYLSPVTNNNGKPKDISHITVYARGTSTPAVPVPAALPLILTGLGGLGALAMQRRRTAV